MRRDTTIRVVVAGTVLCVGLAACSASDGDEAERSEPSTTTRPEFTLADWQQETTAVCNEFEPQQDAIVAQFGQPQSLDDVVAFIDALTPVADAYTDALNAVRVPDERSDEVRRTRELNTANMETAARARIAAVGGNAPGTQFELEKLANQSTELIDLLNELGVPACARPAGG
jgi:hypothetical protein